MRRCPSARFAFLRAFSARGIQIYYNRAPDQRLRAIFIGAALLASHAGHAQTAAAGGSGAAEQTSSALQEVVVTGRFIAEGANSSMKLDIPARDVPFSIDNYTNDFMKAIETVHVADLYRYMTGLQKAGGTGYDLTLRGFSTSDTDRNTVMTDGLPGLSVRFGSPPTIGTDHIELVKGAASLLYGQSQPGGFVNIITKRPQSTASTEIAVRGTHGASDFSRVNGGDVSVDSTGPLTDSGNLLYRVVGQASDDHYFRNLTYEKDLFLAPSATWRITPATDATMLLEYRSADANYSSFYLLAPRKAVAPTVAALAPIQTNYMAPGSYLYEKGVTGSLFLKHRFEHGVVWNFSFRDVDHKDTAHAFDIGPFDKKDPTFQTLDLRARGQSNVRLYVFADTNLVVPFDTGPVAHKMIVGLNLGQETDDFTRTQFCNINAPGRPNADPTCNISGQQYTISVLNPSFAGIPPPSAFGPGVISTGTRARNYVTSVGEGAYVSDLMTLTSQWKVLAGVRYSRDRLSDNLDLFDPTVATATQTTSEVLPQAGLIFQPNKAWSLYASYSTSYTPVDPSNIGLTTQPLFKPTKGEGEEIGVKSTLLGGRIDLTTAVFSIDQKNVLAPYSGTDTTLCPSGSCSIQVGAARSKGAEFEISARPIDRWTFVAGYAYTDASVRRGSPTGPLVGEPLPNAPKNAAHFWSRYEFGSTMLGALGIGLGYSYTGARVANSATVTAGEFALPSYQVVDLGLYDSLPANLDLTLKINNLLDKHYYSSGTITQGMFNVQPGFPRSIDLTVTWKP